ncbi:hypothetical protein [Streptomyces mangrovisoli]|uniref:Prevent-host-death family protein n=1 Tax=Streptomyces mangrovisoli TaxID=1428628 RepID=A0A1J4P0F0_9ACTN|nr:hypothetical protein [Streptomyces mangrovisoli]OIJ67204.1 hypothetical protein WN71_014460 [Streptomyces mangrovisoli]
MTTTPVEANLSELLQKPTDTIARMQSNAHRGIRLHRRGEEDLYLTTAARAEEAVLAVDSTTRIFVAMMKSDPQAVKILTHVFPDAFPWVRYLPDAAVREFLVEFVETARAAVDLDNVSLLAPVIAAWKSTALVHADPELRQALTEPKGDDLGPVEPPEVPGE